MTACERSFLSSSSVGSSSDSDSESDCVALVEVFAIGVVLYFGMNFPGDRSLKESPDSAAMILLISACVRSPSVFRYLLKACAAK